MECFVEQSPHPLPVDAASGSCSGRPAGIGIGIVLGWPYDASAVKAVILDVETVCVGVSINSCGRGEQDNECAKADLAGAGSSSADANAVPATSIECTMATCFVASSTVRT